MELGVFGVAVSFLVYGLICLSYVLTFISLFRLYKDSRYSAPTKMLNTNGMIKNG
jgi:hypothetical protein